jgi:site-specific DNA-methyltransferase (adenine-specific)
MTWAIHQGDAIEVLRTLPDQSVHCCVTSPPYFHLRDYGCAGQIGDEPTIAEYLDRLVAVFGEVRRVLRNDGVVWINMGDGYISDSWGGGDAPAFGKGSVTYQARLRGRKKRPKPKGLKLKDMIGMPWRLAFALQEDGWFLRSDTIWHRQNPMPESVHDRPAKAHEYVILLSKRRRYWFGLDAIKEPVTGNAHPRGDGVNPKAQRDAERAFNRRRRVMPEPRQNPSFSAAVSELVTMRNPRTVWTIPTQGSPVGGTVLDPFVGRGTTVIVALRNQRHGIGIDLSPEYCEMSRRNIIDDAPLFNRAGECQ